VVDLTKPCVKCGQVDRYSNGICKPCKKTSVTKYSQSDQGRAKRREYSQSDKRRAKTREYRQSDENRAKHREYQRQWCQSNEVRAKIRERKRKKLQTAIGRQRHYAAQAKYKKKLFEFSLQNQQKVIKQCQQNLTQPNEKN